MLRTQRDRRGFTQETLARKAGLTQAYLAQLEAGVRKNPSLALLKRLARALGVDVADLIA